MCYTRFLLSMSSCRCVVKGNDQFLVHALVIILANYFVKIKPPALVTRQLVIPPSVLIVKWNMYSAPHQLLIRYTQNAIQALLAPIMIYEIISHIFVSHSHCILILIVIYINIETFPGIAANSIVSRSWWGMVTG